jgi:protein-tyrosine phosphatase
MGDGPFWISLDVPGRLGTMPRPRGGDWLVRDLNRLRNEGVTKVISMLDHDEVIELELTHEAKTCEELGMVFCSLPVVDRSVPVDEIEFWNEARNVLTDLKAGGSIVIHCRAGIGRSSLLAAAVLTLLGDSPCDAFAMISAVRGLPIPDTSLQRSWFEKAVACVRKA